MDDRAFGPETGPTSDGSPRPRSARRPALEREISLPALVLYGLGTTIGAGIYALTGEVAGSAGMRAPISFLIAALLAEGYAVARVTHMLFSQS